MTKTFTVDPGKLGGNFRVVWSNGLWDIIVWPPVAYADKPCLQMAFYKNGDLFLEAYDMFDAWDESIIRHNLPAYVFKAAQVILRRVMRRVDYWTIVKAQAESGHSYFEHAITPQDSQEYRYQTGGLWQERLQDRNQRWVEVYRPMV